MPPVAAGELGGLGGAGAESVLRAMLGISGEVEVPRLLQRLLAGAIEISGAQGGWIALQGRDRIVVEALSATWPLPAELPDAFIREVLATRRPLLAHPAVPRAEGGAGVTGTMLGLPIGRHAPVRRVLVLEHGQRADACGAEQRVLAWLADQAAISLENAELRDGLEQQVRERTAELTALNERLRGQQHALERAKELAERAAGAKSEFLATMSHELRTPMNAVLGIAALLQRTELSVRQRAQLGKLERSGRLLLGLIGDILDFSKLEAGRLEIEQRPFDLRTVLDDIVEVGALQRGAKTVELLLDLAPDLPTQLVGDSLRLSQVLLNLVSNAIKFTEQGEVVIRVAARERRDASALVEFSVRDTGIGLSEAQRRRLFRPFMQGDASTSRRYGGTGLGLAISRQLITLMHGRIELRSVPGVGSEFSFALPFALQVPQAPASAEVPAWARRRVLVLDDHAGARSLLVAQLAHLGLRAEAVATEAEAARSVAASVSDPFDFLLIDRDLGGHDGLVGAEALRAGPHRGRPVLMLASAGEQVDRPGLVWLSKPVTPWGLHQALRHVLGGQPFDPPAAPDAPIAPAPWAGPAHAGRPPRILLVEDNDINLELAHELLTQAGLSVTSAGNGVEALARLEAGDFDLVLMDCQMPVMDGYEATQRIRQNPRWQALPIIAMTANARPGDREKSLAAGMNDQIDKPIDIPAMFATLQRWL